MRILHTSDWHLGRLFHQVHLTEDQAHVLAQLVELVRDEKPDVVIVAGDIYDRAVPPPEAVTLLDQTLTLIAVELATPVVMIAGNHDSPQRLGFGARLMKAHGVHVVGSLGDESEPLVFKDENGPVHIVALPYAEPAVVREALSDASLDSHDAAMQALTARAAAAIPAGRRSIAIAHAYVAGGTASDSERPLAIGGSAAVDPKHFECFSYTALGHLHQPQTLGNGTVRYCGSLLKYSFSEASHRKSVTLVELGASGVTRCEPISLSPRRDVRILKGDLADLLSGPKPGENRQDYVMAELTDRGALLDPMGKLREVYPNCLHIDRSAFLGSVATGSTGTPADHRSRSVDELFRDFVEQVTGEPLSETEADAFHEIVDGMMQNDREAGGGVGSRRESAARRTGSQSENGETA